MLQDKIEYTHPSLSVQEQIDLLLAKGLIIADKTTAEDFLSHVSYFRFKNYSWSFKDYTNNNGNYIANTRFEQVMNLYLFDRKLKLILFSAIENIEVSVKTQLSNIMAVTHGSHWYMQQRYFISAAERRIALARDPDKVIKSFDHDEFLQYLNDQCDKKEELFLKYYVDTYTPKLPPSWMMMELITFGTLSLMFENLQGSPEKNAICESFKLTKAQLVSWLHSFAYIRNRCVHHARIVYNRVIIAPAMPVKSSRIFLDENNLVQNNSIYAIMSCIQYLLNFCNSASDFKKNIHALVANFPDINYEKLGFTPNWQKESHWN